MPKCSGLLEKLESGDNIIADILPSGVTLTIPSFKGGRDHLNPEETNETARIAAVRIHVERGIVRTKNYLAGNSFCQLHLWWIKYSQFAAIWPICSHHLYHQMKLIPVSVWNQCD